MTPTNTGRAPPVQISSTTTTHAGCASAKASLARRRLFWVAKPVTIGKGNLTMETNPLARRMVPCKRCGDTGVICYDEGTYEAEVQCEHFNTVTKKCDGVRQDFEPLEVFIERLRGIVRVIAGAHPGCQFCIALGSGKCPPVGVPDELRKGICAILRIEAAARAIEEER